MTTDSKGLLIGRIDREAPEHIWLQVDPEETKYFREQPWPTEHEITWCAESVGGLEIEYVRNDLHAETVAQLQARVDELEAVRPDQQLQISHYPPPRNRDEAVAIAKIALAYIGVVDAHIDAAIARCETNSQRNRDEQS